MQSRLNQDHPATDDEHTLHEKVAQYFDALWRIARVTFYHAVMSRMFGNSNDEAQQDRIQSLKIGIAKRKRSHLAQKIKTIRKRLFLRPKKSGDANIPPPDFTP